MATDHFSAVITNSSVKQPIDPFTGRPKTLHERVNDPDSHEHSSNFFEDERDVQTPAQKVSGNSTLRSSKNKIGVQTAISNYSHSLSPNSSQPTLLLLGLVILAIILVSIIQLLAITDNSCASIVFCTLDCHSVTVGVSCLCHWLVVLRLE